MKRHLITIILFLLTMSMYSQSDKQQFEANMKMALQGNAVAQNYVGWCYQNGIGIEKNTSKSFDWYMKAAQQGNANAQFNVGWCYQNGIGIEKNIPKSFDWYMKSAQQGNADAQNCVGWCYEGGQGTEKNEYKAFEWYMKSAQQGNSYAQNCIGREYMYGQGIEKNEYKAFEWYMKAAQQGNADAQNSVGWCYSNGNGTEKNEYKAFEWLLKAAQQGNAIAQFNVGLCYAKGQGTEKNECQAFEWYMQAVQQNIVEAYNEVAYCYMLGKGININKEKAWEFLNKALAEEPNNPNYIDSKGEFYSIEGNVQKALETWDEINKVAPNFYSAYKETAFSKYVQKIKGDNIDLDVPTVSSTNKNTFAIIIANENYQDVSKVPFAINDGNIFAEYCGKTLGIPSSNISFIKDATLNNIRREINWLKQVIEAYNGEASVIVYYAGHGIPDEAGKTSYILPIDGIGNDVSTGYSLQDLYSTLSSQPAKHITVFLDACFSGANRDGNMLASARGVAIKAKQTVPTGNLVVFSAAQGDETAYPYKEQQHGLFTYYLLKKIKETKGDVSLGELGDYVSTEVKKQSIVINRKSQTPMVSASTSLGNNWKTWTLK